MELIEPLASRGAERSPASSVSHPASFSEVFSSAVQARNLPLDRLQAHLARAGVPVSVATLSYWQTGRSRPRRATSLRAVAELERVLEVPTGHLQRSLAADGVDPAEQLAVLPFAEVVQRIVGDMGLAFPEPGSQARSTVHDTINVDADRRDASQLCRRVMQADVDGPYRWPVLYRQDADEPVVPVIEAVKCCRLGQVVAVPQHQLTVAELITPKAMHRGDWVLTEHRVTWARTDTTAFRVERFVQNPLRDLVMEVTFDGTPPTRATRYRRRKFDDPVMRDARPVTIQGNAVQSITFNAGRGGHGVTWEW